METTKPRFSRIRQFRTAALKCLFLYLLAPGLLLAFFAGPIGNAGLDSDSAAFRILLGALGAVGLNWAVYAAIRRKHPSLLVFTYGTFLLFVTVALQYMALPGYYPLVSTLAIIGVTLLQAVLILLSFWFASLKTKPACAAAVTIRVIVGIFLVLMAIEIISELENGLVNGYTWLTLGILIALLMGLFSSKIAASLRRSLSRRRKTGRTPGKIVRIVGTTHLDPEDELITLFHAHIRYTVDGVSYETRTGIPRRSLRRYGKEAFIGSEYLLRYDPANPAEAYLEKIQKPGVKEDPEDDNVEDGPEQDPPVPDNQ